MWTWSRRVLQDLLLLPVTRSFSLTAAQQTVVVERWWQVPLSKVGRPPRLHPRRHRIYKLVEDTTHTPTEKMELILTQNIPKLGGRGDTVFVKKSVGRNKLLAQGLAVYPSAENKQMFSEELRLLREGKPEDRIQTRTGQMTVEFLKRSKLKINKMPSDEFQLTKDVVCRQFGRKLGVFLSPHTLSLPFEPIKDLGEYWCDVTVNGVDTVRIPMSLLPYEDQSTRHQQQLKAERRRQAAADVNEAAALEAVSPAVEREAGEDSEKQAAGGTAAVQETTTTTKTVQDTTAPQSESPDKN
ncbi:39S ribosomal protein L9, mitochondrial [Cololabis saira]|uniref:39S ribosomal protein L9, mitochondrial n=1 Tax=Cololabis saira TaxID=129043 RepID=UPI002AD3BCB7|nr:39S ribosomal protein L9, mitochondrial [Cololabis saira]